jgi:hypothetical protein
VHKLLFTYNDPTGLRPPKVEFLDDLTHALEVLAKVVVGLECVNRALSDRKLTGPKKHRSRRRIDLSAGSTVALKVHRKRQFLALVHSLSALSASSVPSASETFPQNSKERWNGLAVFEHQPIFAADERGTHLAGKMLHPVKDGFPFASLGKLDSRVGEGNRKEL